MTQKVYIFIGPPGSGKGTQAKLLSKRFGVEHFSMGQALRDQAKKKTAAGRRIAKILAAGSLVSDSVASGIISKKIAKMKAEIIIDGFPRKLAQAKILNRILAQYRTQNIFFELYLSSEKILERIAKRRDCECGEIYHLQYRKPKVDSLCDVCGRRLIIRNDSKPAVVKARIKSYQLDTKPVLRFIKKNKNYFYHKIDASPPIQTVHKMIVKKLNKMNAN